MRRRHYVSVVGAAACGVSAGCLGSGADTALPDGVVAETVTEDLSNPWGLAFLPDDPRLVVTERDTGRVVLVDREDGTKTESTVSRRSIRPDRVACSMRRSILIFPPSRGCI